MKLKNLFNCFDLFEFLNKLVVIGFKDFNFKIVDIVFAEMMHSMS